MTKIPRITSNKIIAYLETNNVDVTFLRQKGSHRIYKNNKNQIRIVVPVHSSKILHPKIIKEILIALEISLDELLKNL